MDEPATYRVLTRPGPDAESEDAREIFSSLLGAEGTTSNLVLPPGTQLGPHRHTADVAAGVVSGAVTFVFGADGTGRVELGPGDYLWIAAGVMHDEETSDGVELVVANIAPFETLTED
jgi:quercetin dioxygenase-like cupin family protein